MIEYMIKAAESIITVGDGEGEVA